MKKKLTVDRIIGIALFVAVAFVALKLLTGWPP